MNPKQQHFADEYLIDLNATRAYKTAYPSVKNDNVASAAGARLLGDVKVSEYIKQKRAVTAEQNGLTRDKILQAYQRLAFYDARKLLDANGNHKNLIDLDDDTAFAVMGVDSSEEKSQADKDAEILTTVRVRRIRTANKKDALDSICKVLGFNAPDKTAATDTKGNDIKLTATLSDKQFNALLNKIHAASNAG